MSVYRLKPKQRHHRCGWCAEKALYRGVWFSKFACEAHRDNLVEVDRTEMQIALEDQWEGRP